MSPLKPAGLDNELWHFEKKESKTTNLASMKYSFCSSPKRVSRGGRVLTNCIVVNDVPYFFATPIKIPIMTIKRKIDAENKVS
jgi:hypothetical protein